MIRIIFLSLLTLTLSCANTRPEAASEQTEAPATPAMTPTEQTETPKAVAMAPEATRKLEQLPAMKSWTEKVGTKTSAKPASKAKSTAKAPAAKPTPQPTTSKNDAPAADTTVISAPVTTTPPVITTETDAIATAPADTIPATALVPAVSELPLEVTPANGKHRRDQRFLPTRRRIDREINKLKFAYKGEIMMGITASYGTLSGDDAGFLTVLTNIDANATIASVKPFLGYFYRDNNCIGVRFGYSHSGGKVDKAVFDLGPSNDTSFDIPYVKLENNNYSFGVFHRSYAGLDPKGRFGLFAEFELAVSTGSAEFSYKSNNILHQTFSDNTQVKLSFNPGAAVYIFPNVCATLSFGLGGVQYTSVTQKDADGNKIGSRKSSNMKFKLNIAAINFGMTIHLWDKKKQ